LNLKEDSEWNLGQILSGLESIGHENISQIIQAFRLRFENKTKARTMEKMMKRLEMEQHDLISMAMMSR
jgi:hypothetical protein